MINPQDGMQKPYISNYYAKILRFLKTITIPITLNEIMPAVGYPNENWDRAAYNVVFRVLSRLSKRGWVEKTNTHRHNSSTYAITSVGIAAITKNKEKKEIAITMPHAETAKEPLPQVEAIPPPPSIPAKTKVLHPQKTIIKLPFPISPKEKKPTIPAVSPVYPKLSKKIICPQCNERVTRDQLRRRPTCPQCGNPMDEELEAAEDDSAG